MDRATLERLSCRQLMATVQHAHQESPFYRNLSSEARLNDFPVVNKDMIRRHYPNIIAIPFRQQFLRGRYTFSTTSGTTGYSLRVPRDVQAQHRVEAVRKRLFRLYDARQKHRTVFFDEGADSGRYSIKERVCRNYLIGYDNSLQEQVEQLEAINPDVICVQPSTLRYLVYAEPAIQPRVIITVGEVLDAGSRDRAMATFDCQVFDIYSTEEFGNIAWQCPEQPDHYHVNPETVFLEVVADEHLPPMHGRAVVTSLVNRMFPLVRYDTGDVVERATAHDCNFSFPAIGGIVGRYRAMNEESSLQERMLAEQVFQIDGVRRFQVVSDTEGWRVLVDVAPNYDSEDAAVAAGRAVGEVMSESVEGVPLQIPLQSSAKSPILPLS